MDQKQQDRIKYKYVFVVYFDCDKDVNLSKA
jgi:hypothetical protein